MHYRRTDITGGTYFFTVNLAERHQRTLVDHIDLLRQTVSSVKQRHPFRIDAIVVLPDHLHAVWTLPEDDADYPKRWMLIKTSFSRLLPNREQRCASRKLKGERGIWQRRYWEHLIRDLDDFRSHIDYIHYNPVKHGYVKQASEWPFSSIHSYVSQGILPSNWGSNVDPCGTGRYGEP